MSESHDGDGSEQEERGGSGGHRNQHQHHYARPVDCGGVMGALGVLGAPGAGAVLAVGTTALRKTVEFQDVDDGYTMHDAESLSLRQHKRGRLTQPRMSLLGRPLNYRASRRDARYRRIQSRVYNFLERPRGFAAILYHILVFCLVFMCLTLSVFSTIDEYEEDAGNILFYMESIVVVWFTIEFFLRLWSSGCRSRYQGYIGRLKFLRRPFCIIDVTTIVASVVVLALGSNGQVFAASALRGLRFFQILRMVRMDRRGGTWKLLGSVVYAHRQELITTLYIGFLGLIFASFLVFLAEKDVNKKFSNFAQALWWGVITLCTVGYGDMVPETWQGKIIASFCALLGISFFALPAGILGSGFALKVQQQQRQKHMIRRRQPAAMLIQSLWRCYAADEQSLSIATWRIHHIPAPSPPTRVSSSFKHNASFVSRLPTIRRHKSTSLNSPNLYKPPPRGGCRSFVDINTSSENIGGLSGNGNRHLNASHSEDSVVETTLSKRNSDDEEEEPRCSQLTNQHKGAIRAIRKMKYFVARRKFKEALKPYDVKDVIEQYSSGHVDLLGRVKTVQTRYILPTHSLIRHVTPLITPDQLKYFVARKKFREALKPYDVKDVIEQYSSGHADLLNRVRNLQFRLDQILGKQGSKAKDVYASKISLASRVVKVERQVDEIEVKLDQLLELYTEDRKRFYFTPISPSIVPDPSHLRPAIGESPPTQSQPLSPSAPPTEPPTASTALKPKPILVDKQSSEPSSPITKVFNEQSSVKRRPMHRGYSDLGNRVKKKVTLSAAHDGGDVVIVVPSIEQLQLHQQRHQHQAPISVHSTIEIYPAAGENSSDPTSPRTTTEPSAVICSAPVNTAVTPADEDEDDDGGDSDTTLLRQELPTEVIICPKALVQQSNIGGRRPATSPASNVSTTSIDDEHKRLL